MQTSYKTPGVYVEEISKFPPKIVGVETSVPAFIGYTEKAQKNKADDLLRVPVKINSFIEYETYFGSSYPQEIIVTVDSKNQPIKSEITNPTHYRMYYALKLFFDNGGESCYIVSVGTYDSAIALESIGTSNTPIPGGLDISKEIDEVTLLYFPDAHALDAIKYYTLYNDALKQCGTQENCFTIVDVKKDGDAKNDPVAYLRGANGVNGSDLKYGAAYWPFLTTNMNWGYNNSSVTFKQTNNGILNNLTLEKALCDKKTARLIPKRFLVKMNYEINKLLVEVPPGAAIAGIYAKVDSARGVWKAPANVSLTSILNPSITITDNEQASLNTHSTGKSVNCIRRFKNKGILVWGARTLAGNDNEWRYIPVRRLCNMVEKSVKKGTAPFVFEPNDSNTWIKVKSMIEYYLSTLWKSGAMAGASEKDAFYVKAGLNETMTSIDILEGRMIVEIGMAVVRPAEFIILQFSHKMMEA